MKIAVIGSNGQLGSELCKQFDSLHQIVRLTHEDIEITNIQSVQKVLNKIKPDVVINTAAYHNLPDCEKNPEISFQVNTIGALNLAKIASDCGFVLVQYSTDYVFDGQKRKPYLEKDMANPLNIYGMTKLNGEISSEYLDCMVKRFAGRRVVILLPPCKKWQKKKKL